MYSNILFVRAKQVFVILLIISQILPGIALAVDPDSRSSENSSRSGSSVGNAGSSGAGTAGGNNSNSGGNPNSDPGSAGSGPGAGGEPDVDSDGESDANENDNAASVAAGVSAAAGTNSGISVSASTNGTGAVGITTPDGRTHSIDGNSQKDADNAVAAVSAMSQATERGMTIGRDIDSAKSMACGCAVGARSGARSSDEDPNRPGSQLGVDGVAAAEIEKDIAEKAINATLDTSRFNQDTVANPVVQGREGLAAALAMQAQEQAVVTPTIAAAFSAPVTRGISSAENLADSLPPGVSRGINSQSIANSKEFTPPGTSFAPPANEARSFSYTTSFAPARDAKEALSIAQSFSKSFTSSISLNQSEDEDQLDATETITNDFGKWTGTVSIERAMEALNQVPTNTGPVSSAARDRDIAAQIDAALAYTAENFTPISMTPEEAAQLAARTNDLNQSRIDQAFEEANAAIAFDKERGWVSITDEAARAGVFAVKDKDAPAIPSVDEVAVIEVQNNQQQRDMMLDIARYQEERAALVAEKEKASTLMGQITGIFTGRSAQYYDLSIQQLDNTLIGQIVQGALKNDGVTTVAVAVNPNALQPDEVAVEIDLAPVEKTEDAKTNVAKQDVAEQSRGISPVETAKAEEEKVDTPTEKTGVQAENPNEKDQPSTAPTAPATEPAKAGDPADDNKEQNQDKVANEQPTYENNEPGQRGQDDQGNIKDDSVPFSQPGNTPDDRSLIERILDWLFDNSANARPTGQQPAEPKPEAPVNPQAPGNKGNESPTDPDIIPADNPGALFDEPTSWVNIPVNIFNEFVGVTSAVAKPTYYAPKISYTKSELNDAAKMAVAEAGVNASNAGYQQVLEVIRNRVISESYPGTVNSVLNQQYKGRYAFDPKNDGRFDKVQTNTDSFKRAKAMAEKVFESKIPSIAVTTQGYGHTMFGNRKAMSQAKLNEHNYKPEDRLTVKVIGGSHTSGVPRNKLNTAPKFAEVPTSGATSAGDEPPTESQKSLYESLVAKYNTENSETGLPAIVASVAVEPAIVPVPVTQGFYGLGRQSEEEQSDQNGPAAGGHTDPQATNNSDAASPRGGKNSLGVFPVNGGTIYGRSAIPGARDRNGNGTTADDRPHKGYDLYGKDLKKDRDVLAHAAGKVSRIGTQTGKYGQPAGWGTYIEVTRPNGTAYRVAHSEPVPGLKEGDQVKAGQKIATITGSGTGFGRAVQGYINEGMSPDAAFNKVVDESTTNGGAPGWQGGWKGHTPPHAHIEEMLKPGGQGVTYDIWGIGKNFEAIAGQVMNPDLDPKEMAEPPAPATPQQVAEAKARATAVGEKARGIKGTTDSEFEQAVEDYAAGVRGQAEASATDEQPPSAGQPAEEDPFAKHNEMVARLGEESVAQPASAEQTPVEDPAITRHNEMVARAGETSEQQPPLDYDEEKARIEALFANPPQGAYRAGIAGNIGGITVTEDGRMRAYPANPLSLLDIIAASRINTPLGFRGRLASPREAASAREQIEERQRQAANREIPTQTNPADDNTEDAQETSTEPTSTEEAEPATPASKGFDPAVRSIRDNIQEEVADQVGAAVEGVVEQAIPGPFGKVIGGILGDAIGQEGIFAPRGTSPTSGAATGNSDSQQDINVLLAPTGDNGLGMMKGVGEALEDAGQTNVQYVNDSQTYNLGPVAEKIYDEYQKTGANINLSGWSKGAIGALQLANMLVGMGVPADKITLAMIDPGQGSFGGVSIPGLSSADLNSGKAGVPTGVAAKVYVPSRGSTYQQQFPNGIKGVNETVVVSIVGAFDIPNLNAISPGHLGIGRSQAVHRGIVGDFVKGQTYTQPASEPAIPGFQNQDEDLPKAEKDEQQSRARGLGSTSLPDEPTGRAATIAELADSIAERVAEIEDALNREDLTAEEVEKLNEELDKLDESLDTLGDAITANQLGNEEATEAAYDDAIDALEGTELADDFETEDAPAETASTERGGTNGRATEIGQRVGELLGGGVIGGMVGGVVGGLIGRALDFVASITGTDTNSDKNSVPSFPSGEGLLNTNLGSENRSASSTQDVRMVNITLDLATGQTDFNQILTEDDYQSGEPYTYFNEFGELVYTKVIYDEEDLYEGAADSQEQMPPIVVDEYGNVIFSNGTYAPVVINGQAYESESTPEYVYLVNYEMNGNPVTLSDIESSTKKSFFSTLLSAITPERQIFTIDDVGDVTYRLRDNDTQTEVDDYYSYTINLKDGSQRIFRVPEYVSLYELKERLIGVGYDGNVLELVGIATRNGSEPETGVLGNISGALSNFWGSNDEEATTVPSNYQVFLNSELTTEDIKSLTVYFGVDATCPNLPGLDTPYLYQVIVYGSALGYRDTDVTINAIRCGNGNRLTYSDEIALNLEAEAGFSDVDPYKIYEIISFKHLPTEIERSSSIVETNEISSSSLPEANPSTDPALILSPEPTKSNSTNQITFEVKATNVQNGNIIYDWTTSDITVGSGTRLDFRWGAENYQQCLPFLNDGGRYAFSRISTKDMISGNTESENFLVPVAANTYRLECGGQKNGEGGVDIREIEVRF